MDEPYLQRETRRSVLYFSFLSGFIFLGWGLFLIISLGQFAWYYIFAGSVGLIFVALEFAFPKIPSRMQSVLFVIIVGICWYSLRTHQITLGKRNVAFSAFGGVKGLIVWVSVLSPSRIIGNCLLFVFSIDVIYIYYLGWSPTVRSLHLPIEPWLTLIIIFMSLFILKARRNFVKIWRYTEQDIANKHWIQRVAYFMLSTRDLSNSPLQTFRTTVAILRPKYAELKDILKSIETHIQFYHRLNRSLDSLDKYIAWNRDSTSFNALDQIQKEIEASVEIRKRESLSSPPPPVDEELKKGDLSQEAFRAALGFSIYSVTGGMIGIALTGSPISSYWLWFPAAVFGLICLGVLAIHPKISYSVMLGMISIQSAGTLVGSVIAYSKFGAGGGGIPSFDSLKLLAFMMFYLVPSWRVGGGIILLTAFVPVVQYFTWPLEWRSRLALTEPWSTWIIVLSILFGFYLRREQISKSRGDARFLTEQSWLDRLVSIIVRVRQLMNQLLNLFHDDFRELEQKLSSHEFNALMKNVKFAISRLDELNWVLGQIDPLIQPELVLMMNDKPEVILDDIENQIKSFKPSVELMTGEDQGLSGTKLRTQPWGWTQV